MRRLVVCSDGTWNTPDRKDGASFAPSNVVKLARAVLPQAPDRTDQIVFYDPGLGTDNLLDKLTGGAFGVGLSRNVQDGFRFLVHNYVEGDELYLFGFSRGAYTVRSLAGLIRKVGLLRKEHADRVPAAWQLYRKRDPVPDTAEALRFRAAYSRELATIRFIGVWDTVGALGVPGLLNFIGRRRFAFHNVDLSRHVEFAYQALAIDERRVFLKPTLWRQNETANRGDQVSSAYPRQVLEQAWFPGVHMDVGGGYRDSALADGALRWLAARAQATGLALDEAYLARVSDPDPLGARHESRRFPYTLVPAFHRPIGAAGQANETLHPSARAL
jgi:uncharacterized protein (DUF2235 family)